MTSDDQPSAPPQLIRALGRWSMVALAINSILGSGVFGLPSVVAGLLGAASPAAVLVAGIAMVVIIACYAEVASQFDATGGTYLYLRHAFGRLIGLQVGWMALLSRLTACAAAVNLLVAYLAEFWPAATRPLPRLSVIFLFVGTLAAANYRGAGSGARVSNVSVIAKLAALAVICVAGAVWLATHPHVPVPSVVAGTHGWLKAMLLLLFAYGGYEAALNPMGEARNPRRDVAFALFTAIAAITVIYTLLQLIVIGALPEAAASARPLADVARVLMGPVGASFIAAAALLSVYGYLSANMLTVPRNLYALAEHGDFPRVFAAVHPRFRTPYVSILVFALLLWGFAQFASFSWNVTLSAVARVLFYGAICAAVPVLRRRHPGVAALRLPGGLLLPAVGMLICAVLLAGVDFGESAILLATIVAALLNWLAVRRRGTAASGA
jgi:amino acid transporter